MTDLTTIITGVARAMALQWGGDLAGELAA